MRIYYFWDEQITSAGHVVAAFLLFGFLLVFAPGFLALKWTEGFLAWLLLLSVLFRGKKPKNQILRVEVPTCIEGDSVQMNCKLERPLSRSERIVSFRMDASILRLDGGKICPQRRGAFALSKVALVRSNPAGLSNRVVAYRETVELLVAPRFPELKSFGFLAEGVSGAKFERVFRPELFRGNEFAGIREYREGDSLRDLHARAFAKFGRPFTKEYAAESGGGIVLVLDVSALRTCEKMCVESAIRICGSVAFWLIGRNALGSFWIGDRNIRLDSGRSLRKAVLEALAGIPPALPFSKKASAPTEKKFAADESVLRISVREGLPGTFDKQIVVSESAQNFRSDDTTKFVPNETVERL